MANFLSKQLRLFRLAHKITARRGVNNSNVGQRKRNFASAFHKLGRPALPLHRTKAAKHLLLLPPAGAAGRGKKKQKKRLTDTVSPQVEKEKKKFITPARTQPSIRQRRLRDYTSPPEKGFLAAPFHIHNTCVNQSTCRAFLSSPNLPLHHLSIAIGVKCDILTKRNERVFWVCFFFLVPSLNCKLKSKEISDLVLLG